jgi:4-hydroxy-2-oxoheptanedioate aldolase
VSQIEQMIMAAKMHDVDTVVRVRRGSYSDLHLPLEMDAAGIIVPHIMSAAEAKEIARLTRFYPVGMRPADGGNADAAYSMMDFVEYCKTANEQRFVHVQIEDVEAMDELDEIAQVKGIDGLFFGPGDFSQSIGAPACWDDPRIHEARQAVADAANRHGKVAATTVSLDKVEEYISMGYRYLHIGADVIGVGQYFEQLVTDFDEAAAKSDYCVSSGS